VLVTLALLCAAAGAAEGGDGRLVDTVLAEIGSSPVTLSDVAVARALGALGLVPSPGPITETELAHFLDAQLALREAAQLGVDVSAAEVDRDWQAAGGPALATRLE